MVIAEDAALLANLPEELCEGQVWLTVPSLGRAAGPLSWGEYLAHRSGELLHVDLTAIENQRSDPASFPPCR